MRTWILFVSALSLVSPAAAQVINGESIYEDNFAHTPPSPLDKTGKGDAGPSRDPDHAKKRPRDLLKGYSD